MEQKQIKATYAEAVKAIKEAILESRYRAARLVNKEVLALYYAIGGYISVQSRATRWGSKRITGTVLLIHLRKQQNKEQKQITATYAEAVKAIKEAILESLYRAARLVNK